MAFTIYTDDENKFLGSKTSLKNVEMNTNTAKQSLKNFTIFFLKKT